MLRTKPRLNYLIFYITSRCNMRCEHCFYLDELNQHDEMSVEEVEQIATGLNPLSFLRVTGGEPFLRKDLPEVLQAFYRHASTRRMGIITNGSRPEWISRSVNRLLELCPDLNVDVGVSIDGLQEVHDSIRKINGAFDHARETVEALIACKKKHPQLSTSIVMTVTSRNEHQLDALFDEVSAWGVDRLSVNHVRGSVHDASLLEVSHDKYVDFALQCERYHSRHDSSLKAGIQRAKNRLTRQAIDQIQQGQTSDIACLAGSSIGVLYSDGEVALCEMLENELVSSHGNPNANPRLGNVREVDYQFNAIWHSPNTEQCRRWIQETHCSCTHECFLTASILFGKSNYPRLAKEWFKTILSRASR